MIKQPIIELPEELKNLIAAGEVVERPASVVKELVENSIDAEATNIKIDLQDSGLKKITIIDNGYGIIKDQIPIALKRNATSKLKTTDDLFNIASLGFRGEALPSIASVSLFTISSSTNDLNGYCYTYKNGNIINETPCAMTKGTKIEVCDLFYNTPARFKHLSSPTQELANITSFVNKIAIAYPNISFTLINNGKTLLQTDGKSNIELIISETFGKDVAKNIIFFNGDNDLYHIEGYTTSNAINRSNKNGIYLIANGRIIKNQSLIYAITDAYQTILPIGKYPITILNISCEYSLLDVNIHPSKLEIKFTDEYRLKQLISKTIYKVLHEKELITSNNIPKIDNEYNLFKTVPTADEKIKTEHHITDDLWEMFEPYDQVIEQKKETDYIIPAKEETEPLIKEKENDFFKSLNYIGQFNKTYLIMENNNTLYLIDQHAGMERYMYETIKHTMFQEGDNLAYDLLIPLKLEYNISSINLILEHIDELYKMHIVIEQFGNNTILIRQLPYWIPKGQEENYIRDIIDYLLNNKLVNKQVMQDSLAKKLSCKKSIKANMEITEEEVKSLMEKLDTCNMPFTCPHGRPTIIQFSKYELEKMFKRVI